MIWDLSYAMCFGKYRSWLSGRQGLPLSDA